MTLVQHPELVEGLNVFVIKNKYNLKFFASFAGLLCPFLF